VRAVHGERRTSIIIPVRTFVLGLILGQLSLGPPADLTSVKVPGGAIRATVTSTPHLTISASASAAAIVAGKPLSLYIDIVPNPSIHVYAPGALDYQPITFTLDRPSGITARDLKYPKSEILFFEPLNEHVPVFQKPFRLEQDLTVSPGANVPTTLEGTLAYQACDDTVCFVPKSVEVKWEFGR